MIVDCPHCESRYRVREDRVPAGGGRVECPNCGEVFFIEAGEKEGGTDEIEGRRAGGEAEGGRLQEMADEMSTARGDSEVVGEEDPTEIITSEGGAPDFLEKKDDGAPEDGGTIEMRNPYLGAHGEGGEGEPTLEFEDGEDDATTKVDRDELGSMFEDDWLDETNPSDQRPGSGGASEGESGPVLHSYQGQSSDITDAQESDSHADDVDVRVGDAASSGEYGRDSEQPAGLGGSISESEELDRFDAQGADRAGTGDEEPPEIPAGSADSETHPIAPAEGGTAPSTSDPLGDETWDRSDGGGAGEQLEPPGRHDGPWKVKARHGLSYEFPDTASLREWMVERENFDNLRLSPDGTNYFELSSFPQVADLVRSGGDGGASGFGQPTGERPRPGPGRSRGTPATPPAPPSESATREEKAAEPAGADWSQALRSAGTARPERSVWTRALYPILFVLILVAGGIFLDISGLYPVGRMVPGISSTAESEPSESSSSGRAGAAEEEPTDSEGHSEETRSGEERSHVDRVLDSARDAIEKRRWQSAIDNLKAAKLLAPKNPETYFLLAEVYEQLGQGDRAEENRERAENLESETRSEGAARGDAD